MAKQNLNSLDRYRKQSSRLVLEVYSHCEVPAGCGGSVLRWRNPNALQSAIIHFYSPAKSHCWIDGEAVTHGRLDLAPGPHVIAISLDTTKRDEVLMLTAILPALDKDSLHPATEVIEKPLSVLTASDGSWKYSLTEPPTDWIQLAFVDAAWDALKAGTMAPLDWSATNAYQQRTCLEHKASPLIIAKLPKQEVKKGPVWIRKVFDVPSPTNK